MNTIIKIIYGCIILVESVVFLKFHAHKIKCMAER